MYRFDAVPLSCLHVSNCVYCANFPFSQDFSNIVIAIPMPILSSAFQASNSLKGVYPPRELHLLMISFTFVRFPLIVDASLLQNMSRFTRLIRFNNFVSARLMLLGCALHKLKNQQCSHWKGAISQSPSLAVRYLASDSFLLLNLADSSFSGLLIGNSGKPLSR